MFIPSGYLPTCHQTPGFLALSMMFILAGLVYVFVGNFPPGHILLLAGVAAAAGCITQEDRPGLATGPA